MKLPVILLSLFLLSGCTLLPPSDEAASVTALPTLLQPPALPAVVEVAEAADIYGRLIADTQLGATWSLTTQFSYEPALPDRPYGIIRHRFADVWFYVAANDTDLPLVDSDVLEKTDPTNKYHYVPVRSVIIPVENTKYFGQLYAHPDEWQGVEEMKQVLTTLVP